MRTQPSPGPHVQPLQGASEQVPESAGQPNLPPHCVQVASCSAAAGGLHSGQHSCHQYRGMACQHDRDTVPILCPQRGKSGVHAVLSSALVTWVRAVAARRRAAAWEVAKTLWVRVVNLAAGDAALKAGLPLGLVAAVA